MERNPNTISCFKLNFVVCGECPKDLVNTWVVLILDTLLIYFWGALLGLNLPADLGPVLVMLFTKSNEHNFPFNFQVIFRPKTSTRNRRFERSKRRLKNAAAVTRKRFERRFRSRQKTSRRQFSRVNVSRPLTGLKTTGTNIIKLFCCK